MVVIDSITFHNGQSSTAWTGGKNNIPLSPISWGEAIVVTGHIPLAQTIVDITPSMDSGLSQPFTLNKSGTGTTSFQVWVDVDEDLYGYNETSGAMFYTGQQITFRVHFVYLATGGGATKTYDLSFVGIVGPVVQLNAGSANLKPAYNETTTVTVNASEYQSSGGVVSRQDGINCGGGISATTTNPVTGTIYNLGWAYDGGTIGLATSDRDVVIASVSPTGLYTLRSNKSPEAPEGTITATLSIDSAQSRYWIPAVTGRVSVSQISLVKILRAQDISVFRGNPRITDPVTIWDNTMSGPVKMPARGSVAIIFANIPEFIDEQVDINTPTYKSKAHIVPGNNNLYSYRQTGKNSRFFLDRRPWYTCALDESRRALYNATHYIAVDIGSLYDGTFGRADAEGYYIAKNSNASKPYQIKIVTTSNDTAILPDDASGIVYTFDYILDDVVELKTDPTEGYKVLGVHLGNTMTIRVWHTQITNATQKSTGTIPDYTQPDQLITAENISFEDASSQQTMTLPSCVSVSVSAYQQDSESHLFYTDVTLTNTADIPDYEDLPTSISMIVTVGRLNTARIFYLAYARLNTASIRSPQGDGSSYEYNQFWEYGAGTLNLPSAYNSFNDLQLDFDCFPGGLAGEGYQIESIKFDYPNTDNDELGNIFTGTLSDNQWVGSGLDGSNHVLTGRTTRNGYHIGSYEEYNLVITTADNNMYIQKFSFPTMCTFSNIDITEETVKIVLGDVTYGLFIPEHDYEFTFVFMHQYKQWSTISETFIVPADADKVQASDVKFWRCNESGAEVEETNAIEVRSIGYTQTNPTASPVVNAYCTVKLVNPPTDDKTMFKIVVTCPVPSGKPYIYEDTYLGSSSETPGRQRLRQLELYCVGGGSES